MPKWDEVDAEPIDVTGDGGILKKIIKAAPDDAAGPPPNGFEVIAHYTGTLSETGEKFDSSRDRNDPFKFAIGQGQVSHGHGELVEFVQSFVHSLTHSLTHWQN